MMGVNSTGFF
jgi:hypothetical protein